MRTQTLGIAGAAGPRGVVFVTGGSGGDLALDAAQQLMVGVAERADALALKLGGDGGQVEPGCRGAASIRSAASGSASSVRATVPWSANARSVCSGIVLITSGPISSET